MRRALVTMSLAGGAAAALVACVDLFHSTDYDLPDGGDAEAPIGEAAAGDASDAAPALGDFCAMSAEDGKALAIRSCALLSACETPFGRNATGRCLEKALPIMACAGAPDRPAAGAVLTFYRCLATAKTCEDVDRCVFPLGKPPRCGASAPFTTCGDTSGQLDVRVDCRASGNPASGEACGAFGQTCALDRNGVSHCVGSSGASDCKRSGCDNAGNLHVCVDAGAPDAARDEGFDCAALGGACHEQASDGGVFGCGIAKNGIACTPSASVKCSGSVATGCPAGVEERIDCAALFGTHCIAQGGGAREVAWDVARACSVSADAGACPKDTCSGATLYACVRGKPIAVDCGQLLGTSCTTVDTSDQKAVATCAAP